LEAFIIFIFIKLKKEKIVKTENKNHNTFQHV